MTLNSEEKESVSILRNTWCYDTCSDSHVCNDITKFINYQPTESIIHVGDTYSTIEGTGTVLISPTQTTNGPIVLELKNTAYIPKFHANLISGSLAKKAGIFFNNRTNQLERQNGQSICQMKEEFGISIVNWDDIKKDTNMTDIDYSEEPNYHQQLLAINELEDD